ncbi:Glutamyl-tRNA(Gln) amidotransferase subunit A mitochondrial [Fasciola hepatica]|uniref:Glutamyl-tRNA(Gln) amidotransferase subunit A mitochondrial n=1 Tax=Fasciola hepatica TaxID=6192 RepID=A0A4E0S1F2_FASHE|nr:Glutamyl-tRNA(Gln) amidotransferase subunit A mitochondrial [Fasciola hepatica]
MGGTNHSSFCYVHSLLLTVGILSDSGAYVLGKTNLDEFAMGCGSTDSAIAGPVINPWSSRQTKPVRSPVIAGGSSGGSAAAVAAGLCPVALASDTGGSSRIPAAYCGVVGLKPTYGLLSRHGLIPLTNSLDVPAVIGASVADVSAVLATWIDSTHQPATLFDGTRVPLDPVQLGRYRTILLELSSGSVPLKPPALQIGIPIEYHVPGLDPNVAKVWDQVAGWFADELKYPICLVRMPHTPMATSVYSVLCATEVASNMARYDGLRYGHSVPTGTMPQIQNSTESRFARARSEGFNSVVRGRILAGNYFLLRSQAGRHLEAARRLWRLVKQDFDDAFKQVDVLLTPVAPGPATPLDQFLRLDNRTRTTLDDVCTVGVNLAGIAAVVVPISLSPENGLPIGLQLIGPAHSEPQLLQLAMWLERRSAFTPLVDWNSLLSDLESNFSREDL